MARLTKKQKMRNLVTFLAASAVYKPAVDDICDIVECDNCPYYQGELEDFTDLEKCQQRLANLWNAVQNVEKEVK